MLERYSDNGATTDSEVVSQGPAIPYATSVDARLPKKPNVEVRHEGPFGWWPDLQDLRHRKNALEIYHILKEARLLEEGALALEVGALKDVSVAAIKAEDIVASVPAGTVARALAADFAGDMYARARPRRARIADLVDAEGMNVIQNR